MKHSKGSKPGVDNVTYDNLNKRRNNENIEDAFYVKGHLLNEQLGGSGKTWENLTPLTKKANHDHEELVESVIKVAVNKSDAVLSYEVKPVYGRTVRTSDNPNLKPIIENEHKVPQKLLCTLTLLEKDASGKWEPKLVLFSEKIIENNIHETSEANYRYKVEPIYLAQASFSDIMDITNSDGDRFIYKELSVMIFKAYEQLFENGFDTFGTYKNLANHLLGATPDQREVITSQLSKLKHVKI